MICSAILVPLYAQGAQLRGHIVDESGDPIIGATVQIIGQSQGGVTDLNGNFVLNNVNANMKLLASYVGKDNVTLTVGNRSTVDIIMESRNTEFEQVVVIGYGESRRSDLTGAIKGISSESTAGQGVSSAEQALLGRVAGVQVSQDYSPGGSASILIRGANSMLGGTEPLYVVDGVPMEQLTDASGENSSGSESQSNSSMNFINPDDIESMEILKDASATAIYGARGANGVVLITTKSAKEGRAKITYNFRYNISHIAKKLDIMDSEQWATIQNQREINRYYIETMSSDYSSTNTVEPITLLYDGVTKQLPEDLPYTDWQDAMYDTALSQSHTVQASASNKDTKYFLSLGYSDQNGIMINTNYERFTLSSNVTQKFSPKFSMSNKMNATYAVSNGGMVNTNKYWSNVVTSALAMQPTRDLYTDIDDIEGYENVVNNPYLQQLRVTDENHNMAISENLSGDFAVNKYLTLVGRGFVSYTNSERSQYYPVDTIMGQSSNGKANVSNLTSTKLLGEFRANYNRRINLHNIGLMGAYTYEDFSRETSFNSYANFPNDDLTYYNLSSATEHWPTVADYIRSNMQSYIARANYSFANKYYVTATFRADGSSVFAANNKWGYFPSVALAWRASKERFIPKTKTLNDLKVRFSYGQTGSQSGLSAYGSLASTANVNTSFNNQSATGIVESVYANPDLGWETTTQYNAGVDFVLFNRRVLLTIDAYYKKTDDLLQSVQLPESTGYSARVMNMGSVENKGVEVDLTLPIISKKDMSLKVNLNGAVNRNKVLSLGSNDYIIGPEIGDYTTVNRFIVGQPLGVFWGLKCNGVVSDWTEAKATGLQNMLPGEYSFQNISVDYQTNTDGSYVLTSDGTKVPTTDQVIDEDDMTIIGDPNPDFTYGANIAFTYKNFDLSILLQGQFGGDVFWYDYSMMSQMNQSFNTLDVCVDNSWVAPMDYSYYLNGELVTVGNAKGNTTEATLPAARDQNSSVAGITQSYRNLYINSSSIFDATYLKIANITIGYSLKAIKALNRVYLSASVNNLCTFTKYPGYDPAALSFAGNTTRQGIDFGSYPPSRTYIFSASLTF
ncbi:MAG: TonB-dependent receptor [Rikenellaceae bacterium]